jgi:hypothetical protein
MKCEMSGEVAAVKKGRVRGRASEKPFSIVVWFSIVAEWRVHAHAFMLGTVVVAQSMN